MSATFFNLLALGAQMPTGIYYQGENSMAGDQTRYLSRSLEIVLLKSSFLPFTGSLSHILTSSKVGTEKAKFTLMSIEITTVKKEEDV